MPLKVLLQALSKPETAINITINHTLCIKNFLLIDSKGRFGKPFLIFLSKSPAKNKLFHALPVPPRPSIKRAAKPIGKAAGGL
jgi:hypothetical protein